MGRRGLLFLESHVSNVRRVCVGRHLSGPLSSSTAGSDGVSDANNLS